jgi:hypothetical protein
LLQLLRNQENKGMLSRTIGCRRLAQDVKGGSVIPDNAWAIYRQARYGTETGPHGVGEWIHFRNKAALAQRTNKKSRTHLPHASQEHIQAQPVVGSNQGRKSLVSSRLNRLTRGPTNRRGWWEGYCGLRCRRDSDLPAGPGVCQHHQCCWDFIQLLDILRMLSLLCGSPGEKSARQDPQDYLHEQKGECNCPDQDDGVSPPDFHHGSPSSRR